MGKFTISMTIFNSYLSLPEGNHHKIPLNPIKPPFSYGFPMVVMGVAELPVLTPFPPRGCRLAFSVAVAASGTVAVSPRCQAQGRGHEAWEKAQHFGSDSW